MQLLVLGCAHPDFQARSDRSWTGSATTTWSGSSTRWACARGVDGEVGFIGGRPFVNNASFGAYAAVVQSPAYRDDKRRTTTEMLPDLLAGPAGAAPGGQGREPGYRGAIRSSR
jgi:hypothetical protein